MPIIAFCHHFSEKLKSLELCERSESWVANDFRQLVLHKMEHLEKLTLTGWSLSELLMAIQVLTPSDKELRRNKIKLCLPSLESLALKCGRRRWAYRIKGGHHSGLASVFELLPYHSDDPAGDVIDQFLLFLEKRRAGECTPFQLDLPVLWSRTSQTIWTEGLQDKLRNSIEDRCIEVLQDGQVLDWL